MVQIVPSTWDYGLLGFVSTAFGRNTSATENYSTAAGYNAWTILIERLPSVSEVWVVEIRPFG